jgi:CubicO group peptidase (beta-lactamase class C family)
MRLHQLFLASLLLIPTVQPVAAQDPRAVRMDAYLQAAARLGQLDGAVLVAERGKILVDTAFGFANLELGVRNTPNTRFRVASVTKQFTAMAVMMLAEAGKLHVADPISLWLDSLPPEWSGITIHHLLRHTSGISDYEEWFDGYRTQAYSDYMAQANAPARIAHDARNRPLDFPPGTQFHYSNSAYVLLGYIIQRASGMAYDDFIRTRILEPLGMTSSLEDRSDELIPDRAQGYRLRDGAYPIHYYNGLTRADFENAHYQLMAPPQGEAGLVTTTHDLYRWDQALYTDRLVPQAALDSIFTPGLGNYGYGWFIRQGPDGVAYEHSGGLPGFACDILRVPGPHRTIIVLGNLERLGPTVRDLAAILRGEEVAPPRARHLIAGDSAASSAWSGMYRTEAGDSVEVSMDGSVLTAWWRGHFRVPLYPESARDYFVAGVNGSAHFRPGSGSIELLIEDRSGKAMLQGRRGAR